MRIFTRDSISLWSYRLALALWEEYAPYGDEEFTINGMVEKLLGYIGDLEHNQKIHEEGYREDHATIARATNN